MKKLVAVYGTLKRGQGNNGVMGDSKFIMDAYVNITALSGRGFPVVKFPHGDQKPNHKLHVEIFEVTDEDTMRGIDRLEGYTEGQPATFYDRIVVPAYPMDGSEPLDVYLYEYVSDIEDDIMRQCVVINQGVFSWPFYQ